jgi:hypothetical protein
MEGGTLMGELLNAALVQLQGNLPRVAKGETGTIPGKDGKQGYSYRYADLADVSAAILPLLAKCGLAFTALPDMLNGAFGLSYQLRHVSGEQASGFYPLPDPARTTPQQVGSAITYARRYSLCAVTGVAPDGDDDDASSATRGFESFDDARPADATRGSGWQAPANPHSRKATRSKGQLPDDQWSVDTSKLTEEERAAISGPAETAPGTSNLDQQRQIAIRTGERGLKTREEKLAFCAEIVGRPIASSKDLSFTEAVEVLRVCAS